MKRLFIPILLSTLLCPTAQSSSEEKKALVTTLVDLYRDKIFQRYGQEVKLKFSQAQIFQMTGGHNNNGELEITIYAKALEKFDKHSLVMATCHELGHILGEVTIGDAGGTRFNALDSVEGEADYFAGSCAKAFFRDHLIDVYERSSYCESPDEACHQTMTATGKVFFNLYDRIINEEAARSQIYSQHLGINPTYPKPECRLLSTLNGILDLPRPKCWYNPI